MQVVPIPAANVPTVWRLVDGKLKHYCVRASDGGCTLETLFRVLTNGEMQLWVVWDDDAESDDEKCLAAVVTQIGFELSGQKICTIYATSGRRADDWVHLIDKIEDWAAKQGCERLHILGRKGWAAKLPDYRLRRILLSKDLTNKDAM
jgi:hypothetical protein